MQDLRVLRFRRGSRVFTTLAEGEAERLRVRPTLIRRRSRVFRKVSRVFTTLPEGEAERLRVRPTLIRSLVLERSLLAVGELATSTALGHIGICLICECSDMW